MTEPQSPTSRVSVGGANVSRATIRIVARFALGWAVLGFVALLVSTLLLLPLLPETVELDLPARGRNVDFPVNAVGLFVAGVAVTALALLAAIAAVLLSASAPGFSYITSVFVCIVVPMLAVVIVGNGLAELARAGAPPETNPGTPVYGFIALVLGALSIFAAMRLARDKKALG